MTDRKVPSEVFDAMRDSGMDPVAVRDSRKKEEARQARVEQYRADDEKARREREARREAARRVKVDADDEALRQQFLARYMAMPGSRVEEFNAMWPTIRRAFLEHQLLHGGARSPQEELVEELRARNAGAGRPE